MAAAAVPGPLPTRAAPHFSNGAASMMGDGRAFYKSRHCCIVARRALSIVVLLNVLGRHSLREKSA